MKSSSGHTQVDIGKRSDSGAPISKISPAMCELHKSEEMKVFCLECAVPICTICFIKSHKTHNCSDTEELSDNLRRLIASDSDKVTKFLKETAERLSRLAKEKSDFIKHLAGIADEVNTAADKLIAAIQRDRLNLLSEVESIKQKRLKQVENVEQEVKQRKAAVETFQQYSETLLSGGTASDVVRSANSLHHTADELTMFDVIGHVDRCLPPTNVTFTLSTLTQSDRRNLVGAITVKGKLKQIYSS